MSQSSSLRNVSHENLIKYINHMIRELSKSEVKELEKNDKEAWIKYMAEKYYRIRDLSMSLYDMIIEQRDNFEFNRLMEIFHYRDMIKSNQCSYDNINKEIGQKYFDEFVKPVVDKIDKQNNKDN